MLKIAEISKAYGAQVLFNKLSISINRGEKSRVMPGKLLVTPCHLLFLDKPTNHLDMQSCDSLIEAIDDFDGSTHSKKRVNIDEEMKPCLDIK